MIADRRACPAAWCSDHRASYCSSALRRSLLSHVRGQRRGSPILRTHGFPLYFVNDNLDQREPRNNRRSIRGVSLRSGGVLSGLIKRSFTFLVPLEVNNTYLSYLRPLILLNSIIMMRQGDKELRPRLRLAAPARISLIQLPLSARSFAFLRRLCFCLGLDFSIGFAAFAAAVTILQAHRSPTWFVT